MMPKRVAMIKEEELVGAGRTQATLSMDIPQASSTQCTGL